MKRAILKACAVLLCNMAFFCAVRGATISGGGLAATGGHNWVGRGVIEYEEGEGKTYSLIIRVFADDGRTNARSVTMKWSGETSLTFNAADYASVGYTIKVFVEGGAATSMVVGSRYVPPNVDPSQRVFVLCDLKIENTTGAENLEGWVEINGTRYGPAPVGGLEQTIELGAFEPGTVIPITYGSGVTGSPSSYTVPDSPGEQVSFSVNATTGGGAHTKVEGKITEFKDGRWYGKLTVSDFVDVVIVNMFTSGGFVSQNVSITAPGIYDISVPVQEPEADYDVWILNLKTGEELDRITVPYTPLKVSVVANLNISNPSAVTREDAYVSINGQRHETGNSSMVKTLQLGVFEPNDTIPVLFGSGISGSNKIYTVPDKRGETVSFDVTGTVKNDGDPENPEPPVEPPPVEPPPPEGVDPGNGPGTVDPGEPTNPKGGDNTTDAVKNLEKTVIEEGQKSRNVTADGFNKVNEELHKNTETNLEALRRVQEAIQKTEYAVRDEAVKTRNADARNTGSIVGAIGGLGEKIDELGKEPSGGGGGPDDVALPEEIQTITGGNTVIRSKLEKLNVLKDLEGNLPTATAPVFDLTVDLGVTDLNIHADFGEEQYRKPVENVRAFILYMMFFGFVYLFMKVIGKAWGL